MKRIHSLLFLAFISISSYARVIYTHQDSLRIETVLAKAALLNQEEDRTLFLAREFIGTPYVAHTLDLEKEENLIINTRELDCTTFVETVVALRLCDMRDKRSFADYCEALRSIRYTEGKIAYVNRNHYFTTWIESNAANGFVKKIETEKAPFTAIQHLNVNYMTTHWQSYAMLAQHPEWIPAIKETEKSLTGKKYRYIPKAKIANSALLRSTIIDGDILAILTSKKGLDTSHIGLAVWHKDGLHLLNASQIHKRVIEEPMTLYTYMKKHSSQTGIRIARLKVNE